MFASECNITIGNMLFTYTNSVVIEESWQTLTDTAVIQMPRNIKLATAQLRDLITPGMQVSIDLGYAGELYSEFTGYVVRIKPGIPLVIECEDQMYQLKKGSFTKAFPASTTLDDVIKYVAPGYSFRSLGKIQLGAFTVSNATPAKVFEEIKKITGLPIFFRKGILTVGCPYDAKTLQKQNYVFNQTMLNGQVTSGNVIDNDLEYKNTDDIKIKVQAVSMQRSGGKVEVSLGDPDGENHTLTCPCDLNKDMLTKYATQQMQRLKVNGYRGGGIHGFGWPRTASGDVVRLSGSSSPLILGETPLSDHDGSYFVDAVTKTFDIQGYKRIAKIGPQAAGYKDFNGDQIIAA